MVVIIAVVVGVAVVTVAAAVLVARRRSRTVDAGTASGAPSGPSGQHHTDRGPMTGLEDALNQLTDASGHTMAQRLDQEAPTVDELRVPDDTGPLLRRVLDSLETTPGSDDADDADDANDANDADEADDANDADEAPGSTGTSNA